MINKENTEREIGAAEERQMFGPNLRSALLVPVKVTNLTAAIISLAEMRSWHRYQFRQVDIQFVTSMASILSMAMHLQLKRKPSRLHGLESQRSIDTTQIDTDRNIRVRSSLTGILGSVELLNQSNRPTEEKLKKCLSIIDKAARKISEYF